MHTFVGLERVMLLPEAHGGYLQHEASQTACYKA